MKRINYNKWLNVEITEIPRKIKKSIYGTKISRTQLRKNINNGKLIYCPKCRHDFWHETTGNMACYPELWEYTYCRYCGLTIGGADNSIYKDIIDVAKELFENEEYRNDIEAPKFNTLYDAVKYIGNNMKDYI